MKKKMLLSVAMLLSGFVVVFVNTGIAEAAPFARGNWYGYFYNGFSDWGDDLFTNELLGVNDVNSFVNFYAARVNDGSPRRRAAAAFTILTMLGAPAGTPVSQANARFGEWERAVRWYNDNGRINWNLNYSYTYNTYLQNGIDDVAWYVEPASSNSIVFINPSGSSYAIKKDCANPVGDMGPLFIPPPPTVVNCSLNATSPPNPIAQQPITISGTATYSGGPGGTPGGTSSTLSVSGVGTVGNSAPVNGNTLKMSSAQFTVPNGGNYTVTWTVRVNETTTSCTRNFFAYPPTLVSCGNMSVDPPNPEVGQQLVVTTRPGYTGGPPSPNITGTSITVTGPGYSNTFNVSPTPPVPNNGGTIVLKTPSFVLNNPGTYTVSWTITVNNVQPDDPPCGGTVNDTFNVSLYPFLSVSGGDLAAGARFATTPGNSCTEGSDTNAGITSWNKGAPGYSGANNQYGMSAFSYIQEILGNKGNGNSANAWSLSFANEESGGINSVDQGNGRYGGFNNKGPCVDAWQDKPATGKPISSGTVPGVSGVYVAAPGTNLTLNGGSIATGTHITIYVEGNVSISGDIRYASTSWSSLDQIPSFTLVVKGSIFIGSGVGELDGNYVAVPDAGYAGQTNSFGSPEKGTISTCSSGFAALSPTTPPVSSMVSACNNKLLVYGTFSANQIWLLRTFGTMSSGVPAEQFIQSPESWLAPGSGGSIDPSYKSVVGLPPVL